MFNELQYYSSALGILAGIAMAILATACTKPTHASLIRKFPNWVLKERGATEKQTFLDHAKMWRRVERWKFVIAGFLSWNIFQYDSEGKLYATYLIQPCLFCIILLASGLHAARILELSATEPWLKDSNEISTTAKDFQFHYSKTNSLRILNYIGFGLYVFSLPFFIYLTLDHGPVQVCAAFIPGCTLCMSLYFGKLKDAQYGSALYVLLQADNDVLETLKAKYSFQLSFLEMYTARNTTLQTSASGQRDPAILNHSKQN